MASPAQKLKDLVQSGEVVLSGKAHGGAGRSFATLGGRRYSYAGGQLTKTLGSAVMRASQARPPDPIVIGDLVADDGDDNRKPSKAQRTKRREGVVKIQRAVRARLVKPVRDRNAYVHQLVEGLGKLNRGEVVKLDIDLKRVKTKALKQLIVRNVVSGKRLALKLPTGAHYFLNDRTLQRLADGLIDENHRSEKVSDEELVALSHKTDTLELVAIKDGRKRPAGAFFKYTHSCPEFDWSRYGIFTSVDPANYTDNCLWLALKAGGLPDDKLERLKLLVVNRFVPKCKLGEVCAALEIHISLKTVREDVTSTSRQEGFGDKGAPTYQLGLVDEHFFIIEPVDVTSYALEHRRDLLGVANYHELVGWIERRARDGRLYCQYFRNRRRFVDSFRLFQLLLANREALLDPIVYCDAIQASQYYDKVLEFGSLEYSETNLRQTTYKPKGRGPPPFKVFFDFETTTAGEQHEPYLVRYETQDGREGEFRGEGCALAMLQSIARLGKKSVLLLAHNANYDVRFLLHLISQQEVIDKAGRFLSVAGLFTDFSTGRKVRLAIRDSYRMIDMPLRAFGKSFQLDIAKEVLPYPLFTPANVALERVPLAEALSHVAAADQAQFLENAEAWGCLDGDQLDHIKYSSHYCRLDCSVLRQGWETFRGWMLEYTGLDPDDYITLQSLAADFMVKEQCFDGVPQLSGVPQAFISRCVVGGRVMANSGTKWHVRGKVADFDACSLYPSAMKRLGGYLLGAPKVLGPDQLDYGFLRRQDGYFVKIRVTSVAKRRQFPLASVVDRETGTRDWTNDLEGEVLYLDKAGLEDLLRFQGVEFEILQGYFFDEGRNDRLGATIQHLYDLRRRLKREKNPAQLVMKLLMNSAYGRTILKPIETDCVVVPEERWEGYQSLNYNWIERAQKVGARYYVKRIRSVLDHFNHAQAGVEVLSMSKRLMNEVMCLAEDEGHTVYYQDTDSMHIDSEAVPKLAEAFRRECGQELIGEDMGQFHVDFDLPGTVGEIHAKETIVLGKKCYLDVLEGTDKDGNTVTGEHIRMKGVPTASIRHAAQRDGISVTQLYRRLHQGKAVTFDLTCGGQACGFKYQRDLSVRSYKDGEFTRTIRFAGA